MNGLAARSVGRGATSAPPPEWRGRNPPPPARRGQGPRHSASWKAAFPVSGRAGARSLAVRKTGVTAAARLRCGPPQASAACPLRPSGGNADRSVDKLQNLGIPVGSAFHRQPRTAVERRPYQADGRRIKRFWRFPYVITLGTWH